MLAETGRDKHRTSNDPQGLTNIPDHAAFGEALPSFHGFEAMALAGILPFAFIFSSGAVGVSFAAVDAITVNSVPGPNGESFAAIWRVSGEASCGYQGHGAGQSCESCFTCSVHLDQFLELVVYPHGYVVIRAEYRDGYI